MGEQISHKTLIKSENVLKNEIRLIMNRIYTILLSINSVSIITIVVETCLYVNLCMTTTLYLILQIVKTAYIFSLYIFALVKTRDERDLWEVIWTSVVVL